MSLNDVPKGELIAHVAEELKKLPTCKQPAWAPFVKTGAHKERPPVQADWWHHRLASVLRRVAQQGPIGVSKLRKLYGGKRNRGFAPSRTCSGSGNILRKTLQQLEKTGFVKQVAKGTHKGRELTPQGRKFLDQAAKIIMQQKGIVLKKTPQPASQPTPTEEPKKTTRKKSAPRKKKTEPQPETPPAQP